MKYIKSIVITLLLTTVLAIKSNAQDESNKWVVSFGANLVDVRTPEGFGNSMDDYATLKDANIIPSISRIAVDRYIKNGFTVQLAGSLNDIETGFNDANVNKKYYAFDANLKYDLNNLFGQTGWFDPYVNIGTGFQALGDDNGIIYGGGLGFNTWINENFGLNFQTGYKQNIKDIDTDVFQHSISLAIKFGGKDTDGDGIYDDKDACPKVAGLKEFNGCPDTDNDGVIDSEDTCPKVAGLKEFNGCPDTDNDGVIDSEDICPKVAGLKVNNGCPDTDGDGVIDSEDTCPKVVGEKANKGCPWSDKDKDGVLDKDDKCIDIAGPVSNNGCPVIVTPNKEVMNTLNNYAKTILFDTAKSSFKSETYEVLTAITEILKEYPNANFKIGGHTDSVGNIRSNQLLSEKRANAVTNYLISNGINASRLTAIGYGETSPIDTNITKAGRKNNRRVEVTLK